MIKRYSELCRIQIFQDRLLYLRIKGLVGDTTFGGHRYLNQVLYHSNEWKDIRREIIIRDNGCDLSHSDYPINGKIYIHHLNPITIEDILERRSCVFDPENLVCSSFGTHNAIHYGVEDILSREPVTRTKNDTCPWR